MNLDALESFSDRAPLWLYATVVFDVTIGTLGDLRAGRFEVPIADSWHAGAFLPT